MEGLKPFILGGVASVTAECFTYPIDLTKTRLQLQGQQVDQVYRNVRYRGMLHAFSRIVQEEGFRALYAGFSAGLLRQAVYGSLKIGMYKSWKQDTLGWNMICGAAAGIIAATLACPTDVLKVRMQAVGLDQADKRRELGILQLFLDTYRKEGLLGLWRGVGPTAQRAAVVAGVELAAYDFAKQQLLRSNHLPFQFEDNKVTHFTASFIAGLVGALASNPIDVVRTRMMNQRRFRKSVLKELSHGEAEAQRVIYRNGLSCLITTVRSEGVLALYKGFMPNWLRLGPWNVVFFITYEHLSRSHSAQLPGW